MSQPPQLANPIVRVPDRQEQAAATLLGGLPAASELTNASTPWKGLIQIAAFFGITFLLAVGLNVIINCGLRQIKTGQFGVSNKIVQGKVNADLIITGSSRALSHYDPRVLQSITGLTAFNIGRNGSQTDMQLAILKTYLKHNRKPRIIVHNLDAFSFVMTREVYDPAQYLPYLGEADIYDALYKIDPDHWWKCKYLPLYGYAVDDMRLDWMLAPLGLLGRSPRHDFYQGFDPRVGTWTEDFASFKAANPDGINFQIEPAGLRVMDDLANVCYGNGIKLIFVYSPEYSEMQALTRNRREIFDAFRTLSRRYDAPIWDFSDWEHSGKTQFFNNSQHLNARGAAIFSADLAHRLATELAQPNSKLTVIAPGPTSPATSDVH